MKIAILGYGQQGRAAYEYWRSPDNQITVCDQNESLELPKDVAKHLGKDHLNSLDQFDLIARSPIVHPKDIVRANSALILDKVTSVTNEFFKVCPTKNIIGVTGTKGKGTTATLIARLLEATGKRVHLGGNIGTPPLDLLKDDIRPDDWVVLELANFQLIDLKYSPHLAVCLMVVPEHLDWHSDISEYITAKQQLFVHQKTDDVAIYYADNENSLKVAGISTGKLVPYYAKPGAVVQDHQITINEQFVCKTDELQLLGKHNWQNVCAAITTIWQVSQDLEAIRSVVTKFEGLAHRLELVRELDNVRYYNDSYAATPDAATAAIEAIAGSKVMIMGGFDRHLPLEHFAQDINSSRLHIRQILLIGASANRVAEALKAVGFTNFVVTKSTKMLDIIKQAQSSAQTGDAIVLSPGFASFDMFKNFEERGLQFKEAVKSL